MANAEFLCTPLPTEFQSSLSKGRLVVFQESAKSPESQQIPYSESSPRTAASPTPTGSSRGFIAPLHQPKPARKTPTTNLVLVQRPSKPTTQGRGDCGRRGKYQNAKTLAGPNADEYCRGMPQPIYTPENVTPAYQLEYSLTVFWRTSPGTDSWLADLQAVIESDGIRILQHRFRDVQTSQFLVSTTPTVAPILIPARIKGRLQNLLRTSIPKVFQRNYDLISIGSTTGQKTEAYVASQVEHRADDFDQLRVEFTDLQIINPEIDLMKPRFNKRSRCTCNVHMVLVHRNRQRVTDQEIWLRLRDMLRRWAQREQCLLSMAGLLPDHLHITLGINPEQSPFQIALVEMNNVAWVHGMQPFLMHSFRVNTFGPYDLGAVESDSGAE